MKRLKFKIWICIVFLIFVQTMYLSNISANTGTITFPNNSILYVGREYEITNTTSLAIKSITISDNNICKVEKLIEDVTLRITPEAEGKVNITIYLEDDSYFSKEYTIKYSEDDFDYSFPLGQIVDVDGYLLLKIKKEDNKISVGSNSKSVCTVGKIILNTNGQMVVDGTNIFISSSEAIEAISKKVPTDLASDAYEYYLIRGVGKGEVDITICRYNTRNELIGKKAFQIFVGNADWWQGAWNFLSIGKSSDTQIDTQINTDQYKDMVFDIGNMIFIVLTAALGVKYIWGSANSKFEIKNSLVNLIVAAILFYGWDAIDNLLNIKELLTGGTAGTDYTNVAKTLYSTIMYVINFLAVGGIIYLGVKYLMASADGKAEIKLKFIPVIMGVIMVYGGINLINFILNIVYGFADLEK